MASNITNISFWFKRYLSLSIGSINLWDNILSYRNPDRSSNLTAVIATSQAVIIKKYHSQLSLKLFTNLKRQVLLVAKEYLQIRINTSGYQNTIGNFYHRNKEKVCQKLRSLYYLCWTIKAYIVRASYLKKEDSIIDLGGFMLTNFSVSYYYYQLVHLANNHVYSLASAYISFLLINSS